jgi:hypothetical protein
LEGVGDTVAQRFAQMITDREKEFEDGLFNRALKDEAKRSKSKNKPSDDIESTTQTFAGLTISPNNDVMNMSLK